MTGLMFQLRRSPRTLLERDGYPGPGPGRLAMVLARAGVGKTAFLVSIGIDALLAGQKVLHISLERTVTKVREYYDDLLMEMLRREKKLEHWASLQLEVERRRHIHTYVSQSFSVERMRAAVDLLANSMDFVPQVIVFDRPGLEAQEHEIIAGIRDVAKELGAELWMSCRTHRGAPASGPGELPPPADRFSDLVDLAFVLDPHHARVRLRVLRDAQGVVDKDLNILLDPQTLLLTTGVKR